MQYKTVIHSPAIRIKNLKRPAEAEDYLTDLLNSHAAQGWNLHSIKEFYLTKKKDTAAAISTASMSYIIIFNREGTPTFGQFNAQPAPKPARKGGLFGFLFGGKKSKRKEEHEEEHED